ncbi:MAG: hypothetical protein ABI838_06815 [Chloroflexota bacterium]
MSSFDVQSMPDADRRRLFTELVRDFAGRDRSSASPVLEGVLTADEVAVTVAAMMRSADVTSFELAALFNV